LKTNNIKSSQIAGVLGTSVNTVYSVLAANCDYDEYVRRRDDYMDKRKKKATALASSAPISTSESFPVKGAYDVDTAGAAAKERGCDIDEVLPAIRSLADTMLATVRSLKALQDDMEFIKKHMYLAPKGNRKGFGWWNGSRN